MYCLSGRRRPIKTNQDQQANQSVSLLVDVCRRGTHFQTEHEGVERRNRQRTEEGGGAGRERRRCLVGHSGDTDPMVCLEIVNLLLKEDGPQVFAEELDHVEIVDEAGTVAGEPVGGKSDRLVSVVSLSLSQDFSLAIVLR
jgi:hypothetical protein